mmetsp:Transcript_21472/g.38963  ORF Transcript_21472/g.38963 Transcript_21472/m.38963 type:complete len:96 (+) Transcript_21472:642-929(+)
MGLMCLFYSHHVPYSQNGLPWEDQDSMSLPSRLASGARSLPPRQTSKTALQVELLPAFTRPMIELCTFSDFNVPETLLASCDEIESEQDDSHVNA